MNRAMRLIDAMSRRDFLKRAGAGAVASAVSPASTMDQSGAVASAVSPVSSASSVAKYWEVDPTCQWFRGPKMGWATMNVMPKDGVKPYFGPVVGRTTKSGIVVNSPEKIFIPDEQFQQMDNLMGEYLKGYSNPNFGPAMNKLNTIEREVDHALRLVLNPNADIEMADRQAKKKAEVEASKKAEAEKARQHREMMHRFHQRHKARHSRMDYAGGSEDVQGTDYTTLEHLSAKRVIEGVVGPSHEKRQYAMAYAQQLPD